MVCVCRGCSISAPGAIRCERGRLRRIRAGARRYLRDWEPVEAGTAIAGMRPATPDSLPVIGGVPGHEGVFAATGHGTLGLTLAPATAAALVPPVLHGGSAPELAPFAVERFATRPTAAARVLREGV